MPFNAAAPNAFSPLLAPSGLSQDGTNARWTLSSIWMIRSNKSFIGDVIWIRGDFVPPFLFCSRALFFGRFTPLHFLMVCRRISELYCEARMERCFALHPNRRNPYAYALLLGDMRCCAGCAWNPTNSTSMRRRGRFSRTPARCELHWIFSFEHSGWNERGVRAAINRSGATCCYTWGDGSAA